MISPVVARPASDCRRASLPHRYPVGASGPGSAILPGSARRFFDLSGLAVRRIVEPDLALTVSICVSEHQPLSEPALAVHGILLELIGDFERGEP